ncbi:MAG: UDP-glucose/GDP-mannose dehydrogenase family protein [Deltaproteobacteria bacterium]|nr:UDP-glucose/GDP-mannose dehydrogenase family protein [Deltaproteobacteria bacterium]MBI3295699.1 UDP-glucose/GDP-mannose dehydrogenase family protein [Deltaproteobacteria bacterium]
MRISVMGTGYVGLVAGACFSDSGNHVTCIDVDKEKIARLARGEIPIFEPGLEELVIRNSKAGRLAFTTDAASAIGDSDVVFIAVGTPSGDDGSLDLRYVMKAIESVRDNLTRNATVVMKSTVPVGTADKAREILAGSRYTVGVVSNPEFLKEGTAINDFLRPERVIIGAETESCRRVMNDLYAPYTRSGSPILFVSNRSAELTKYAANAFLAMKISYINDMALLCEKVGADIGEVRQGLITDSRIGNKFLYPGCGYGGSCFPKDVQAVIHLGRQFGQPLNLFEAVHAVNERQKQQLFGKIQKEFKVLKGKTIGVWGLAFKPMTDDMREAPSVTLIQSLIEAGCSVRAYDPVATHEAKRLFESKVTLVGDAYEAIKGVDALAILTEWNEFRSPDFGLMKRTMNQPLIFDGRNLFNPTSVGHLGFRYFSVGRQSPQ